MFIDFFFLLRAYGVPVTLTEWLTLMEALARGLAFCNLNDFYSLARSILVKSEALFDQYDQAFQHAFKGIETPHEIADEVWQWLSDPLPGLGTDPEEREAALVAEFPELAWTNSGACSRSGCASRREAHHGGSTTGWARAARRRSDTPGSTPAASGWAGRAAPARR